MNDVASMFNLPYIWPKRQPSGSGHIIDHLNLELLLLLYIHGTWLCERDSKGGITQLNV